MARGARVRNLVLVRHSRRNKTERVRVNQRAGHAFTLNLWHVAGDALAPTAIGFVVSMFLDARGVRAVRRTRAVAIQTNLGRRFS